MWNYAIELNSNTAAENFLNSVIMFLFFRETVPDYPAFIKSRDIIPDTNFILRNYFMLVSSTLRQVQMSYPED